MFHLGDLTAESNIEYFKSFGLENESIDIAFVDPGMLGATAGRTIVTQHIKPRAIILMHMRPEDVTRYLSKLGPTTPNLYGFREPMEKQLFAK